ncbi:hypothetical protein MMC25_006105 [Agyrium rufum]|nr:hypothetical protein [Agyrium rufum]
MSWTVYEQTFPSPPNSAALVNHGGPLSLKEEKMLSSFPSGKNRRLDLTRIHNTFKSNRAERKRNLTREAPEDVKSASNEQKSQEQQAGKLEKKVSHSSLPKLDTKPSITSFQSRNLLPQEDPNNLRMSQYEENSPHDTIPLPALPTNAKEGHDADLNGHLRAVPESPSGDEDALNSDAAQNFDLAPPPPKNALQNLDTISERLFSDQHLRAILRDQTQFLRLIAFVNRYKPQAAAVLTCYLEAQKAIKAVEYANAVAATVGPLPNEHSNVDADTRDEKWTPCSAALIDGRFEARTKRALDYLVNEVLPALITHTLVNVVTDVMNKEITGNTLPVMRELVAGLNEVFCLSDPSIADNPIVYASEEFYRTTQYGRDYVIGRNCRFLQGPKTDRRAITRIKAAVESGTEASEVLLNYRRDGSPFLNLVVVAPLYDNRGVVRYFIGAQIDVSGLVENGRGIESFARLLSEERARSLRSNPAKGADDHPFAKTPLQHLAELGETLSSEEARIVQEASGAVSMADDYGVDDAVRIRRTMRRDRSDSVRVGGRRILSDEERPEDEENKSTKGTNAISGRLPGVYQHYLLVRSAPSFRIVFASPSQRIPGLLQSDFLSHVGGPAHLREGLADAFASGVPVTAKVIWHTHAQDGFGLGRGGRSDGESDDGSAHHGEIQYNRLHSLRSRQDDRASYRGYSSAPNNSPPRTRWLSCTPLLGSDDRVGVWMVVIVEQEDAARKGTPSPVPGAVYAMNNTNEDTLSNAPASPSPWAGSHYGNKAPSEQGTVDSGYGSRTNSANNNTSNMLQRPTRAPSRDGPSTTDRRENNTKPSSAASIQMRLRGKFYEDPSSLDAASRLAPYSSSRDSAAGTTGDGEVRSQILPPRGSSRQSEERSGDVRSFYEARERERKGSGTANGIAAAAARNYENDIPGGGGSGGGRTYSLTTKSTPYDSGYLNAGRAASSASHRSREDLRGAAEIGHQQRPLQLPQSRVGSANGYAEEGDLRRIKEDKKGLRKKNKERDEESRSREREVEREKEKERKREIEAERERERERELEREREVARLTARDHGDKFDDGFDDGVDDEVEVEDHHGHPGKGDYDLDGHRVSRLDYRDRRDIVDQGPISPLDEGHVE